MATDSPLTPLGRRYSGEAAIPERPHQEGTIAPPRSQGRFVVDLWAWSIRSELRNGVGLSPVSVISRCEQVTPPNTLRAGRNNRNASSGRRLAWMEGRPNASARLGAWHTPPGPKRDPSRSVLAWPLRHRPLPNDAGCIGLLAETSGKDFWTGTAPPR